MTSDLLKGKSIIMIIGGSISSYRTPDIIREMIREGATVRVVLSQSASRMIGVQALEWASGNTVITELSGFMEHISLLEGDRENTSLLVCPATYNMIGSMARGLATTPAETIFANALGIGIDITIVPAMHLEMYNSPILQDNISHLATLGVKFVYPRIEDGKAKIMWSEEIIDTIVRRKSTGKRILIIAGKSTVDIDPVRSIVNRSTGYTGIALAREAYREGYNRIVYVGNSEERVPLYCSHNYCMKTDSFYEEVDKIMDESEFDLIVVPAALSDFAVEKSKSKLPSSEAATIILEPRKKLLDQISSSVEKREKKPVIFAFKLAGRSVDFTVHKDMITIVNYVENEPFGSGETYYSIRENGTELFGGNLTKEGLATKILSMVVH